MRTLAAIALSLVALTSAAAPAEDDAVPAPLRGYAGRVVYVDFWASWCTPCAESFPWLNRMQAKYGPRLAVVGVSVDTEARDRQAFLARHPAQFDIVADPQGALAERYRIEGMPSAVLLDADGRVLHRHSGFRQHETAAYEAAIRHALDGLGRAALPPPTSSEGAP